MSLLHNIQLVVFLMDFGFVLSAKCYSCATTNMKENFLTKERGPLPRISEPKAYDNNCNSETWILKERATVNCDGYCFKWTQTLNNSGSFSSMTFRGCYRAMFDMTNPNIPREPTHAFCTVGEKPLSCLSDASLIEHSCWCEGEYCNSSNVHQYYVVFEIIMVVAAIFL